MNPSAPKPTLCLRGAAFTLILALALFLPAPACAQAGLGGHWEGNIDRPGKAQGIRVDFAVTAAGWQGSIDIPDSGIAGFALQHIVFEAGRVHFERQVMSITLSFDGKLDGDKIAGTFSQGSEKFPFSLERKSAATSVGDRRAGKVKCVEVSLYDQSYALVIGVSRYQNWPSLNRPGQDVAEVSRVLTKHGFQVQNLLDPTRDQILQAINKFIGYYGAGENNRLLIYYAGHGLGLVDNNDQSQAYIVPSDAPQIKDGEEAFRQKVISLAVFEGYAQQIQAKHVMFVFDAPFSYRGPPILVDTRGAAEIFPIKVSATEPVRIVFASGIPDEVAPARSIFREAFVEGLEGKADVNDDGYITATALASYISRQVAVRSKGKQRPIFSRTSNQRVNTGEFVFVLPTVSSTDTPPTTAARGQTRVKPSTVTDLAVRSGNYWALIIGVKDYPQDPSIKTLTYPIQDAINVKDVLTKYYTFDEERVFLLKNPDKSEIIRALDGLVLKLREDDNLLIFFAGHGLWDSTLKQGYWWPTKARRADRVEWLSNSDIRDYIGGFKANHVLLIADACFSGGIFNTRDPSSTPPRSIEELLKRESRGAITSGAKEQVPDKSVFAEYLVKHLTDNKEPFLSALALFNSLREPVTNNSATKQVPQYGVIHQAGDDGGDFLLVHR